MDIKPLVKSELTTERKTTDLIKKMNKQNWFLLTMLLAVWGLNYPIVKIGLYYSSPLAFSFYRVTLATIISLPLALHMSRPRKQTKTLWNARTLAVTALFAATSTVIFLGFWFIGESLVDPGITAVIIYTYPLFIVLFARAFISESLTRLKIFGILLGFIGTFLVLTSGNVYDVSVNVVGFALLFIAAVSFAGSTIIYRKWLLGYERISLNALQLLFACSMLLVWTLVSNPTSLINIDMTNPIFILSLLFTAVLGTTISYLIWMTLLEKQGPVWLSGWLFLVPVVALFSSVLILQEQIDLIQLLGFGIIIFGIAAVNRQ